MEITIRRPLGYSQIGRKDQQEDAVWPSFADVTSNNHCIVLCDGVGGSEHGEVASQTSSKVIGEYLTGIIAKSNYVCDEDVQDAVNMAYDKLEELDTDTSDGGTVSMATTLTCVCFHTDGILAAHMGDSRIYHVRPGQGLLYQSADHSLVNALLQAGELTVEEAKVFPRKNVITKAIQPHGNKRFKAEVHQLTDVKSGDYIFLCCDGVLEQLTNERLVEILSLSCSDEEKKQIVCWGDSLTAPHTGKGIKGMVKRIVKGAAYPEYLEGMLEDNYEIINCGVGGENTLTIMARQGAYPMQLAHDVVIFKSDEAKFNTFIGNNDMSAFVSSYNGKSVTPLLQCGWDCRFGKRFSRLPFSPWDFVYNMRFLI